MALEDSSSTLLERLELLGRLLPAFEAARREQKRIDAELTESQRPVFVDWFSDAIADESVTYEEIMALRLHIKRALDPKDPMVPWMNEQIRQRRRRGRLMPRR